VFRRYLTAGIEAVRAGATKPTMAETTEPLVLKTVDIDPDFDDILRVEVLDRNVAKNTVLLEYLAVGLSVGTAPAMSIAPQRVGHPVQLDGDAE
jgi:hypothetical protein